MDNQNTKCRGWIFKVYSQVLILVLMDNQNTILLQVNALGAVLS